MPITYEEVEKYHAKIKPLINSALSALEDRIISGRDEKNVPVYLTKLRVKSIDSIYLKTKRKAKASLSDITDYGGFRILCLFEQDLVPVHEFLINVLANDGYELVEFKVFNWEKDSPQVAQMNEHTSSKFKGYESDINPKESGYKSIHYVIKSQHNLHIEIQLRTLLQDVWAELEHALSYKQGSIHPHIKKSFALLARDLETDDKLIKHLREISDKEKYTELFALSNIGPYRVFQYDDGVLPSLLSSDTELGNAFSEYKTYIENGPNNQDLMEWATKAEGLYKQVKSKLSAADLDEGGIKLWVDMEKAYLYFCQRKLDAALTIYDGVLNYASDCYVPHFRKGEILFIQGNIEKSLVAFDMCEEILSQMGGEKFQNEYRVKVKLANIYWQMGNEYYDIALQEILEAEKIFNDHKDAFNEKDHLSLLNNTCWYQLENFLLAVDRDGNNYHSDSAESAFKEVTERFEKIKPFLENEEITSNSLDTASWYYFISFKITGDTNDLERAREYCRKSWGKKNNATLTITSVNIHRNHTQEIMAANQ